MHFEYLPSSVSNFPKSSPEEIYFGVTRLNLKSDKTRSMTKKNRAEFVVAELLVLHFWNYPPA